MGSSRVVVVGGGNAGLCAAVAAAENGAEVTVLEAAPEERAGGNSAFTAGAMRIAYDGIDDLRPIIPDLTDDEIARADFGSYPADAFFDDMARVTDYRCDPDLAEVLVRNSRDTVTWMQRHGVRFLPNYGGQAYEQDGRLVFWGGLTIEAAGGGPGLVEGLVRAARSTNVDIRYNTRAVGLIVDHQQVAGVVARSHGETEELSCDSVVLAAGGFQANAEWRTRYLGPVWDLAKVRGTRYNMGDGIRMALEADAMPWGNWSGCHAVSWDLNAPAFGDLRVRDAFQKHSYPLGIMVNSAGKRFVDEGLDFRNYTYARYGREVLAQPGQVAWQVFDGKVLDMLRDEYRIPQVTKARAATIEELAQKLEGVDSEAFLSTITEYNSAVDKDTPFRPAARDGKSTHGLSVQKSNWANKLDDAPFEAYAVTCGITFTFGGLRIDSQARVLDVEERPIRGLFAAGELVGGLFYFNYPGGSGLTNGSVFGRLAGTYAAEPNRK